MMGRSESIPPQKQGLDGAVRPVATGGAMDGIDAIERSNIRDGGQSVVRRLLRHNAIEAWETMQKSGGWKRCPPKW